MELFNFSGTPCTITQSGSGFYLAVQTFGSPVPIDPSWTNLMIRASGGTGSAYAQWTNINPSGGEVCWVTVRTTNTLGLHYLQPTKRYQEGNFWAGFGLMFAFGMVLLGLRWFKRLAVDIS